MMMKKKPIHSLKLFYFRDIACADDYEFQQSFQKIVVAPCTTQDITGLSHVYHIVKRVYGTNHTDVSSTIIILLDMRYKSILAVTLKYNHYSVCHPLSVGTLPMQAVTITDAHGGRLISFN